MPDDVRDVLLSTFEESLDAQLRAVRRLRRKSASRPKSPSPAGLSQVDMAFDILSDAASPLHVSDLIERIHRRFGRRLDREGWPRRCRKRLPATIASSAPTKIRSPCAPNHKPCCWKSSWPSPLNGGPCLHAGPVGGGPWGKPSARCCACGDRKGVTTEPRGKGSTRKVESIAPVYPSNVEIARGRKGRSP